MAPEPASPYSWRLLVEGDFSGPRNMATDVALLHGLNERKSPPTLRIYGWRAPCLSLGRNQETDSADLDFCRANGIEVVRRPTGGRAVLHHHELTYSIVAPLGRDPLPRKPQDAYTRLCSVLIHSCQALGVDATLTRGEGILGLLGPRTSIPCFKGPAEGEVVVNGRKLIGSAMRERHGAILQHGAMLLEWDGRLQAGSMGLSDDSGLRPFVTTFAEQLGSVPDRSELEQALVDGFQQVLGLSFERSSLSEAEQEQIEQMKGRFLVDQAG